MQESISQDTVNVGSIKGSNFGLLFPSEDAFEFDKQTGGMSCRQTTMQGQYLPLKNPLLFQSEPDWMPSRDEDESTSDKHRVTTVDLNTIPDRDFESLPPWVQERGHFYNYQEYSNWYRSEEVWWYGVRDLIEELRKFNYDPTGGLLDRDMSEAWPGGLTEIWEAIDNELYFYFDPIIQSGMTLGEHMEAHEQHVPDGYPHGEGIRWGTIEGSKIHERSGGLENRPFCPWADELKGTIVAMLYPNCD